MQEKNLKHLPNLLHVVYKAEGDQVRKYSIKYTIN